MIRVIVAEDEPLARSRIVRMLKKVPLIQIVAECVNGPDTLETLCAIPSDLLFLDVQMPEMDGFEVLEAIEASRLPYVIFVTAYEKYAIRAFEMFALDYLLKPFNETRLLKALNRAEGEIEKRREGESRSRLLALFEELRARPNRIHRILLKDQGRAWFLKVEEIDWIEAEAKYVRIHAGKKSILHRQSLSELEAGLDPSQFVRIHRSVVVNVDRIRDFRTLPSGDSKIHLQDGTLLTASRTYRKNLRIPLS